MEGWIKIHRRTFEHLFWKEARIYSKAEAWIDLIQMARFEASQEIINNKMIEVQRGEIPVSRRYLEQRWLWGSSKVSSFLELLSKLGMTNHRQTSGQTIIKLVKYELYNDCQTIDKPHIEPATNQGQTIHEPTTNQNKRSKELKKEKNTNSIDFDFSIFAENELSIINTWVNYRKEKKKPITQQALVLLKKDINSKGINYVTKQIEVSIKNGWQGIFELKGEYKKQDFSPSPSDAFKNPDNLKLVKNE